MATIKVIDDSVVAIDAAIAAEETKNAGLYAQRDSILAQIADLQSGIAPQLSALENALKAVSRQISETEGEELKKLRSTKRVLEMMAEYGDDFIVRRLGLPLR